MLRRRRPGYDRHMVPNLLAERYASSAMAAIWGPERRVVLERRLWIAVLQAQAELGLEVPADAVAAYSSVATTVDLESIERRERVLRHDVKARIEEFNALAGHELIHRGLTSRDVTENVEQLLIRESLSLVLLKGIAVLDGIADLAARYADVAITGRTHHQPAQVTTVGKRFANAGEELILALERIEALVGRYPLRGIKGPVGTQQDAVELLGSIDAADELDERLADELGFARRFDAVGQVYPRSLDFDAVTALAQLASAPANLAISIRLMAGDELVTEGFQEGQVGSSAMPHKMNTRSSERIDALRAVLVGHVSMAASLLGSQWNEGDVSRSATRRILLPDAFFAVDGLLETALTILGEFGIFAGAIDAELARYGPFLISTRILLAAVERGMGREEAHEAVSRHMVAAALAMRQGRDPDVAQRIGEDDSIPLSADDVAGLLGDPLTLVGAASRQVARFCHEASEWKNRYPDAASIEGEPIL